MVPRLHFAIILLCTVLVTLTLTDSAMAYIGPGEGMQFFGYALSLMAMLGAAFLSALMWPFYKFLQWRRGTRMPVPVEPSTRPVPDADPSSAPAAPSEQGPVPPPAPAP